MNEFNNVYEITTAYGNTSVTNQYLGVGVAFLFFVISVVFIISVFNGYLRFTDEIELLKVFLIWIFIFGLFLIFFIVGNAGAEADNLIDVYRNGKCEITEGIVHVNNYADLRGKGENISIGGKTFELGNSLPTPGYKKTISNGGALLNGVYARLHYYKGVILKVEVKSQPGIRPYYPWPGTVGLGAQNKWRQD